MTSNPVTVTDSSSVENAILALLNDAVFGANATIDSSVLTPVSINGTTAPIAIFRGWPTPQELQSDVVNSGGVYISVYKSTVSRNTTRFQLTYQPYANAPVTASLTVSGASVTVGGYGSNSNVIGAAYGSVSGSYRPLANESADSELIPPAIPI